MADDEEVIYKGSMLYRYLRDHGLSEFESIDISSSNSIPMDGINSDPKTMRVCSPAPRWVVDHLDNILRCGLLLDDHRHFIENFCPVSVAKPISCKKLIFWSGISWFGTVGSLYTLLKIPSHRTMSVVLSLVGSMSSVYLTKRVQETRLHEHSLSLLCCMLRNLEDLFVQLKRFLLLVQQNEFIAQSFALRHSEMTELRKCLRRVLCTCLEKMSSLKMDLRKEVSLNQTLAPILLPHTPDDFINLRDSTDDNHSSLDELKKSYHLFLLIQSEVMRYIALCYCPELWDDNTCRDLSKFALKHFPVVSEWSKSQSEAIRRNYKIFRAMAGARSKQTETRVTTSQVWDYSDLYIAIHSASLHLQSLLLQSQDIEDILEGTTVTEESNSDSKEFLKAIKHILLDIQKELRSSQTCFEDGFIQVLKLTNDHGTIPSLSTVHREEELAPELDSSTHPDSQMNPPAVDEVFELEISRETADEEHDSYIQDDEMSEQESRKKHAEASKRVLQELKTVLVKKREGWKERERKAMESKGMVYSEVEEIDKHDSINGSSSKSTGVTGTLHNPGLDWFPSTSHGIWPLPRLKGNIPNHRQSEQKHRSVQSKLQTRKAPSQRTPNVRGNIEAVIHQSDIRQAREEELKEAAQNQSGLQRPTPGFGSSILAEAMARSKAMRQLETEDVFFGSGDDSGPDV